MPLRLAVENSSAESVAPSIKGRRISQGELKLRNWSFPASEVACPVCSITAFPANRSPVLAQNDTLKFLDAAGPRIRASRRDSRRADERRRKFGKKKFQVRLCDSIHTFRFRVVASRKTSAFEDSLLRRRRDPTKFAFGFDCGYLREIDVAVMMARQPRSFRNESPQDLPGANEGKCKLDSGHDESRIRPFPCGFGNVRGRLQDLRR